MEYKKTDTRTIIRKSALENEEYFKHIYKKTEKIVCAVFYILRTSDKYDRNDNIIKDLEGAATSVRNCVFKTLGHDIGHIAQEADAVRFALVNLESCLKVATSALIINRAYMEVFVHEIDSVQRVLRGYITPSVLDLINESTTDISEQIPSRIKSVHSVRPRQQQESGLGAAITVTPTPAQHRASRTDRILEIVKDKGSATIKDIVAYISDCSEKTIQRDLINLIKDGRLLREGERRWSKYRVI